MRRLLMGLLVVMAACSGSSTSTIDKEASAKLVERAKRGPYIERGKDISDSETVRVLVVPHPLGAFLDTRCYIYTNRDFRTSSMQCPGGDSLPAKMD